MVASYLGTSGDNVCGSRHTIGRGTDYLAEIFPQGVAGADIAFFTSRPSSAASIPLNVEAQPRRPGAGTIASLRLFGATIGQNGCAGLYPAMLAVMKPRLRRINP